MLFPPPAIRPLAQMLRRAKLSTAVSSLCLLPLPSNLLEGGGEEQTSDDVFDHGDTAPGWLSQSRSKPSTRCLRERRRVRQLDGQHGLHLASGLGPLQAPMEKNQTRLPTPTRTTLSPQPPPPLPRAPSAWRAPSCRPEQRPWMTALAHADGEQKAQRELLLAAVGHISGESLASRGRMSCQVAAVAAAAALLSLPSDPCPSSFRPAKEDFQLERFPALPSLPGLLPVVFSEFPPPPNELPQNPLQGAATVQKVGSVVL